MLRRCRLLCCVSLSSCNYWNKILLLRNATSVKNSNSLQYTMSGKICSRTLSMWNMRSSSQTFSKHLSNVSTNTYKRKVNEKSRIWLYNTNTYKRKVNEKSRIWLYNAGACAFNYPSVTSYYKFLYVLLNIKTLPFLQLRLIQEFINHNSDHKHTWIKSNMPSSLSEESTQNTKYSVA